MESANALKTMTMKPAQNINIDFPVLSIEKPPFNTCFIAALRPQLSLQKMLFDPGQGPGTTRTAHLQKGISKDGDVTGFSAILLELDIDALRAQGEVNPRGCGAKVNDHAFLILHRDAGNAPA
jgi:hypothetical protein